MIDNILFQSGLLLVPFIAIFLVLRAVQKGTVVVNNALDRWCGARIQGIRYRGQIVMSAALATETLKTCVGWLRIAIVLGTLAVYIPLVFNLFPTTKWVADWVFGATADQFDKVTAAVHQHFPTLVMFAVTVVLIFYIIKVIHWVFHKIETGIIVIPGFDKEFAPTTFKLTRGVIIVFALAYLYSLLPNHSTPSIQIAIIITTLIGGLGAKDLISDILSGIILTYRRTFRVGDRIKVNEIEGYVVEKSLLVTNVRTDSFEIVSIPNATLLRTELTNFSFLSERERFIVTRFSVGYDQPWQKVHDMLLAAAAATPNVLQEPPPLITQTSLDDFYSQYALRVYIPFTDSPIIKSQILNQLIQNIQQAFADAEVSLASPHLLQSIQSDT